MPDRTFNVSLNDELADFLEDERRSAGYSSISDVVREAVRQWRDLRIAADAAGRAPGKKSGARKKRPRRPRSDLDWLKATAQCPPIARDKTPFAWQPEP